MMLYPTATNIDMALEKVGNLMKETTFEYAIEKIEKI